MDFLEKLEAFKQKGVYSLNVQYGEGTGCDDSSVPVKERALRIMASPVGYLGSIRVMYIGTVQSFLDMDLEKIPLKNISNPPNREEYEEDGFYFWGTESSIEQVEKQGKVFMM